MPGSAGQVCELVPMLAEYYRARGWADGVVPEGKLRELGIIDEAPVASEDHLDAAAS